MEVSKKGRIEGRQKIRMEVGVERKNGIALLGHRRCFFNFIMIIIIIIVIIIIIIINIIIFSHTKTGADTREESRRNIRASVDALCRDGPGQISRERVQRGRLTCQETTS